jgi:hypothetical protein
MAKIYMLGDSHTQNLGWKIKTRFGSPHSTRFQAFPGKGTRAAHNLASIPYGQDVVVLSLGGNDRGNRTAERQALVAEVRSRNPGATIVWFGPFDASRHEWAGRVHDEQADSQRRQLPGLGVKWVDTRPFSRTGHAGDKVHFTNAGYSRIADAMRGPIQAAVTGGGAGVQSSTGGKALATVGAALAALWWLLRG